MGCSWSSKGRGAVKVHPFSVGGKQPLLNTKRVSKGIHEEPSSRQQQNQELLDTLWKIVDYRTTVDSIPTDKPPRIAKTVHLYVASIFKDFVEVGVDCYSRDTVFRAYTSPFGQKGVYTYVTIGVNVIAIVVLCARNNTVLVTVTSGPSERCSLFETVCTTPRHDPNPLHALLVVNDISILS